jgi:NAD(P)-dependent dehydrogenase (short-subunit alcohol dehydrogenase family)
MLSSQSQPSKGVALVTGAARGIGRAVALRLADDGFDVAVNDLPGTQELDEVVELIVAKGRRALAAPGDVSEESVVADMIQSTVKTLGSLDVVSITHRPSLPPSLVSPSFDSVGFSRARRFVKHLRIDTGS